MKLEIETPGAAIDEATIRILTKKLGETIYIGDRIYMKIAGIAGKQVKLGIEAPAKFLVLSGEKKYSDKNKGR